MVDKKTEEQPKTDLIACLLEMRSGQVAIDLNEKFNKVLRGVLDTGGKGEMTVKLHVRPSKMGLGGAVVEVEMEHDVKVKVPELEIGKAFFFVNRDGTLSREDPAQQAMFSEEAGTRKEVTAE